MGINDIKVANSMYGLVFLDYNWSNKNLNHIEL